MEDLRPALPPVWAAVVSRSRQLGDPADTRGHVAAHHAGLFSFVPKIQTERPSIPTTVPSLAEKACRSGGRTPRLPSNQLPLRGVSAHDRPSQVAEMAPSPVQKSRSEAGTKLPPRGCGLQPGLRRLEAGLLGEWASWSFPCARPCGLSTHPPPPAGPEQQHCNNSCKCERSGDKGRSGQWLGIPVDKQY